MCPQLDVTINTRAFFLLGMAILAILIFTIRDFRSFVAGFKPLPILISNVFYQLTWKTMKIFLSRFLSKLRNLAGIEAWKLEDLIRVTVFASALASISWKVGGRFQTILNYRTCAVLHLFNWGRSDFDEPETGLNDFRRKLKLAHADFRVLAATCCTKSPH